MSDSSGSSTHITDIRDFTAMLEAGCKPKSAWRIGTEHEKFAFCRDTQSPLPFAGEHGIEAILKGLTQFGWEPQEDHGNVIALKKPGGASVTLEPAGQLELSGAPLESLHDTCREASTHLKEVKAVSEDIGVGFLGMGFAPTWSRDDMHWMPKGRYKIMREYMPKRGNLGLDMMTRTCTIQVNLDFASEADMVKKFRVSLALQPVATALFADSPFTEGKPNGYQSHRSNIWTDTDPDRTGMLDFVFEDGFGFERYTDYLLDVPMYFLDRNGTYHDVAGKSFRDLMAGKLSGHEGELATRKDFSDHMTTAFPEVRMKQYLEMRGADGGPWNRICALPAFWVGLLYDDDALDEAWQLVKDFSMEERHALRDGVAKHGLALPFRDGTLLDLARKAVDVSARGLERRAHQRPCGATEVVHLEPLIEIAESGKSPAQVKLDLYHGRWNGDVGKVFEECGF